MLKKFESSDIFVNRIKAHPRIRVLTYSGSLYYNNDSISQDGARLFDFLIEPDPPPSSIQSFTDSFEFAGNWNDAVDITTALSGTSTFASPDFTDSFEFEGNWNDAVDITTVLSGNTTFTSPDFADSFETGSGGW